MQPMTHNPGAAGIGAQVVANGARGLAGGTAASAAVTAPGSGRRRRGFRAGRGGVRDRGCRGPSPKHVRAGRAGPRRCGRTSRSPAFTRLSTAPTPAPSRNAVRPTSGIGRRHAHLPPILAFWDAMPPELNTARLMAGAGAAPMLQAAAGWEAFAMFLETQADELAASLATLTSRGAERPANGPLPQPCRWSSGYAQRSLQAQKRAMQATAQATSYIHGDGDDAAASGDRDEPHHPRGSGGHQLPRYQHGSDRVQRSGLRPHVEPGRRRRCTPIRPRRGLNIHVRADHAAEANRASPACGEGAYGVRMGQIAAQAPGAAFRDAAFAHVGAQATVESAGCRPDARPPGQHGRAACRRRGPEGRQLCPAGRVSRTRCSRACRWACRWPARSDPCGPASAAGRPDGQPTDAAADPTAAAGDVDVQPDGRHGGGDKAAPRWG